MLQELIMGSLISSVGDRKGCCEEVVAEFTLTVSAEASKVWSRQMHQLTQGKLLG